MYTTPQKTSVRDEVVPETPVAHQGRSTRTGEHVSNPTLTQKIFRRLISQILCLSRGLSNREALNVIPCCLAGYSVTLNNYRYMHVNF